MREGGAWGAGCCAMLVDPREFVCLGLGGRESAISRGRSFVAVRRTCSREGSTAFVRQGRDGGMEEGLEKRMRRGEGERVGGGDEVRERRVRVVVEERQD